VDKSKIKKALGKFDPNQAIEVVFVLGRGISANAESANQEIEAMIADAETASNRRAEAVSVMPRVRSFTVRAPAELVQTLAADRRVQSLMLNDAEQDLLIR
jgi:hypothetical protein